MIWLIMPYFGAVPNYFQLYLDSLGRNKDMLSILFLTDIDLSSYRLPSNLVRVHTTMDAERCRAAHFLRDRLNVEVDPEKLIRRPQKLCDFRVCYLDMYGELSAEHGVTQRDYLGWGDCDLVYGRFSDFIGENDAFEVIGGHHGHFTAFRNNDAFRTLYRRIGNLAELLLADEPQVVDEIAFREPLLEFLRERNYQMFYINRYFCDVVPPVFYSMFRKDFASRPKNFFDVYNPDREIDYVACRQDGRLTVEYEDGTSRPAIYCHLQKRPMRVALEHPLDGYAIREDAFLPLCSPANTIAREEDVTGIPKEIAHYLAGGPPYKLEIGAGPNGKPGWLSTDLQAGTSNIGTAVVALDVTKSFPIPDNSFDYVYSEHMIEHVSFDDGLSMLGECHRILKPGGVLRVVTPSIGFLQRILSSDRTDLEDRYRDWSVTACIIDPPAVTNALFLNNFVRAWGHQFIYDHETLSLALELAGFRKIQECPINESSHEALRDLECESRLPTGFLKLESMILEAVKGSREGRAAFPGTNVALGCKADQSSLSPWSREQTTQDDATRVVSGIWTNSYNNHTNLDDCPWWRVDLGQRMKIFQVNIHNRRSTLPIMRRLDHFEICVSNNDRDWECKFAKTDDRLVHGHRLMPFVWKPSNPVIAQFIRIQIPTKTYLHLEQVEVYGESG